VVSVLGTEEGAVYSPLVDIDPKLGACQAAEGVEHVPPRLVLQVTTAVN
jgi:hypothetical protein